MWEARTRSVLCGGIITKVSGLGSGKCSKPWLFDIGDYSTQLYGDYFISRYKEPYKPIIMECQQCCLFLVTVPFLQLMVTSLAWGPVVWIPGIPENEKDCCLR